MIYMTKEQEKRTPVVVPVYLPPTLDFVFKLLFGDVNNHEILIGFLKTVLDLPEKEFVSIEIIDPHLRRQFEEDKLSILDVRVKTKSGNHLDIEMQVASEKNMRERIELYNAKMLSEQVKSGDYYYEVKRAISIIITNFVLIPEDNTYRHSYLRYDPINQALFSDLTAIHILELPKMPAISDDTKLWDWLKFLSSTKKEDFEMIAKKNPEVSKAVAKLAVLSEEEENRLIYEAQEKARWSKAMREAYVREEAEKQGLEQGRKEILTKLIQKKLAKGQSPEVIADDLFEDMDVINEMIKELQI